MIAYLSVVWRIALTVMDLLAIVGHVVTASTNRSMGATADLCLRVLHVAERWSFVKSVVDVLYCVTNHLVWSAISNDATGIAQRMGTVVVDATVNGASVTSARRRSSHPI